MLSVQEPGIIWQSTTLYRVVVIVEAAAEIATVAVMKVI